MGTLEALQETKDNKNKVNRYYFNRIKLNSLSHEI